MAKLTESEWLTCRHPTPLLRHLTGVRRVHNTDHGRRSLVAFIAALCRRVFPVIDRWPMGELAARVLLALDAISSAQDENRESFHTCYDMGNQFSPFSVHIDEDDALTAERCTALFALDGMTDYAWAHKTRQLSREERVRICCGTAAVAQCANAMTMGRSWAKRLRSFGCIPAAIAVGGTEAAEELAYQADLIRDIFANPFHKPPKIDKRWSTSTTLSLAKHIYESRDFSAMPILADALQDAGCENADILNHCRGNGPHVRGCWVVDLVLGKS